MKKRYLVVLALALVGGGVWLQSGPPSAQLFYNGVILTMDDQQPQVEAVLVRDDRIAAVGSLADLQAQAPWGTREIDLQGDTLLPGFIDAHGHFPGTALTEFAVDLSSPPVGEIRTMAQLQQALKARAAQLAPGEWLLGTGYDDTMLEEQRHPTREDLDLVSQEHPIALLHVSGHLATTNSLALQRVGIDRNTPDPVGGVIQHDANGEPNGVLEEMARHAVLMQAMDFGLKAFVHMAQVASRDYARHGITTAQSGMTDGRMLQGLSILSSLGLVDQRLEIWPTEDLGLEWAKGAFDPEDWNTDYLHVGAVKLVSDGSIQGYTGYLGQPYHSHPPTFDDDYRGYPIHTRENLTELVTTLHQADLQIAIHANGDAAIDEVLEALEHAQTVHPRPDPRLIVVHAQMTRQDQLPRMQQLGATPSFFSAHTYYWGDRHREIFIGPERAAQISPAHSAGALGMRYSLHLDPPVVPMQPLTLLWSAVNRLTASGQVLGASERISVEEALRGVTIDAAWQIFAEDERGSITPGKLADLVVVGGGDIRQNPEQLRNRQVQRTVVGGRTIFLQAQ